MASDKDGGWGGGPSSIREMLLIDAFTKRLLLE